MPALDDPKKEKFALLIAQGSSKRDAAIGAGFSKTSASTLGGRLAKRVDVKARIAELQYKIERKAVENAVRLVDLPIFSKTNRVQALDSRRSRLQQLCDERGKDPTMAKVPGGTTGLLVRQYRSVGTGPSARVIPEYVVDTGLLKELRAHEQQAAQELGQWVSKSEVTGKEGEAIEVNVSDVRSKINSRIASLAAKLGT